MIELEGGRRALYQWQLNQRVAIGSYPADTVVDFSTVGSCKNSALPMLSYEEDGVVYADIPNVLLQTAGYLRVFVRPDAGDTTHIPMVKEFRVVRAKKPVDYDANYSETEVFSYKAMRARVDALAENQEAITERVEALEEGAGTIKTVNGAAPDENGNVVIETGGIKTVNGISPDADGNVEVDALPDNDEQLEMLIEADMLPAVHDANGAILTDEAGNIILRY